VDGREHFLCPMRSASMAGSKRTNPIPSGERYVHCCKSGDPGEFHRNPWGVFAWPISTLCALSMSI
jgi:hypothetical protein